MLSNLLDNAVKYSRDEILVSIEVAAPSPDTVWVRVKDRGVGIPRAQLRRIFKRFHRVQARGFTVKGTGLGLYIVRSIVRAAWGARLRRQRGRRQGRDVHRGTSPSAAHLMARLLLVEDEHHLAQGLCFNLEADGHAVTVAGDGETALALLQDEPHRFEAIILDVMLPGRDGFDVAADVRHSGNFVPILMLTARGRAEDILRGFESGADDYLPKPFELDILRARLRGLLRRSAWNTAPKTAPRPGAPPDSEPVAAPEAPAAVESLEPSDAPAAPQVITFGGNVLDLSSMELRVGTLPYHLTPNGSRPARLPAPQRRPRRLAQGHPRRRLGRARGHRHPRHRQLHRAAAPLSQRRPRHPPPRDHGPRRRVQVHQGTSTVSSKCQVQSAKLRSTHRRSLALTARAVTKPPRRPQDVISANFAL